MITVNHDRETDSTMDRLGMMFEGLVDGIFHGIRYIAYLIMAMVAVACIAAFVWSMVK